MCKYGSVGALGGQPPRATRPQLVFRSTLANGPSYDWPSISADGRYVVFASYAEQPPRP